MCDLDALIAEIDAARACASGLAVGVYATKVEVVTQSWTGGKPGKGSLTEEIVEILPRPQVTLNKPRYNGAEAGRMPQGSRQISQVSATYTEEFLTGEDLDKVQGQIRFYLLNGKPYNITADPISNGFGWMFTLSRTVEMQRGVVLPETAIATRAGVPITTRGGEFITLPEAPAPGTAITTRAGGVITTRLGATITTRP